MCDPFRMLFRDINTNADQIKRIYETYDIYDDMCSIKLHHYGRFTSVPGRKYVDGEEVFIDFVDCERFSVRELNYAVMKLGYSDEIMMYHFKNPELDLDYGLLPLGNDNDVLKMLSFVGKHKIIEVYIEHGMPVVGDIFRNSSSVVIEEIEDELETDNVVKGKQLVTHKQVKPTSFRRLLLEGIDEGVVHNEETSADGDYETENVDVDNETSGDEDDEAVNVDVDNETASGDEDYEAANENGEENVDDSFKDNLENVDWVNDVEVNMSSFKGANMFMKGGVEIGVGELYMNEEETDGPLTPTATQILENIKKEAINQNVIFNGDDFYQVSTPNHNAEQSVVDIKKKECTCRRWELNGFPCRHAIACMWDMCQNGKYDGIPEDWVDPVYRLDTWKKVYSFKVMPLTGVATWPRSDCPSKLLPPHYHKPVGRPKRKRKRSEGESNSNVQRQKLTRIGKTVTCSKCKQRGHNARRCTGEREATAAQPKKVTRHKRKAATQQSGQGRQTGKKTTKVGKGKGVVGQGSGAAVGSGAAAVVGSGAATVVERGVAVGVTQESQRSGVLDGGVAVSQGSQSRDKLPYQVDFSR